MKNLVILGLSAVTLFSISAGLSVWLNQPKQTAEAGPVADEKNKKVAKDPDHGGEKTPAKDGRPPARGEHTPGVTEHREPATAPAVADALREKADRLERRQAQLDLILRDLRAEREAFDALSRQLAAETEREATRLQDLDTQLKKTDKPPTAPLPKLPPVRKDVDPDTERKNIARIARVWEAMPAEGAAKIAQQMADTGSMDTVVRVLADVKERQASKILAEIADPALAAQLFDKMRVVRSAPAPAPAGGTTPP